MLKNTLTLLSLLVIAALTAYYTDWFVFCDKYADVITEHSAFIAAYRAHFPAWIGKIVNNTLLWDLPMSVACIGLGFYHAWNGRIILCIPLFLFLCMFMWSHM